MPFILCLQQNLKLPSYAEIAAKTAASERGDRRCPFPCPACIICPVVQSGLGQVQTRPWGDPREGLGRIDLDAFGLEVAAHQGGDRFLGGQLIGQDAIDQAADW